MSPRLATRRLGALLLVLVAAPAAADTAGRVVDRTTGRPLAGVTVSGGGRTAVTDSAGRFVLPDAGELAASAAGFLDGRRVRLSGEPEVELALAPAAPGPAAERALLTEHPQDDDLGDMRPAAAALVLAARVAGAPLVAPAVGAAPSTIRVWRRRVDGSTSSCSGRVDVIPFEDYVRGVVPHEWIPSWDAKALEMGAVCVRTFAWWWVKAGGKYPCADLDDTTASQVYTDDRVAKADAAVDRTTGVVVVKDGALVLAEYSAENGDPTKFGVSEPYCTGQTVNGHGRGTCQWGTQRWATKEGRDYVWMAAHYYPGAAAVASDAPPPTYAARLAAPPAALELAPGATGTARFELTNTGTAAWAGVALVSAAASPLAAPSWLSATDALHLDAAPGAQLHVDLPLRAPSVSTRTHFTQTMTLARNGASFAAADLVTLEVEVVPVQGPGVPDAGVPAAGEGGDATGGCAVAPGGAPSAALLLAPLLGLLTARRRADRRRASRTPPS